VDALKPLLQARWEAIREELLGGAYRPSPVRKVDIPKPGGKGVPKTSPRQRLTEQP
jgi:RNA-directed DNA polymerase